MSVEKIQEVYAAVEAGKAKKSPPPCRKLWTQAAIPTRSSMTA